MGPYHPAPWCGPPCWADSELRQRCLVCVLQCHCWLLLALPLRVLTLVLLVPLVLGVLQEHSQLSDPQLPCSQFVCRLLGLARHEPGSLVAPYEYRHLAGEERAPEVLLAEAAVGQVLTDAAACWAPGTEAVETQCPPSYEPVAAALLLLLQSRPLVAGCQCCYCQGCCSHPHCLCGEDGWRASCCYEALYVQQHCCLLLAPQVAFLVMHSQPAYQRSALAAPAEWSAVEVAAVAAWLSEPVCCLRVHLVPYWETLVVELGLLLLGQAD